MRSNREPQAKHESWKKNFGKAEQTRPGAKANESKVKTLFAKWKQGKTNGTLGAATQKAREEAET
jgi:hypothetical protein